jgi:hypothetical protein
VVLLLLLLRHRRPSFFPTPPQGQSLGLLRVLLVVVRIQMMMPRLLALQMLQAAT